LKGLVASDTDTEKRWVEIAGRSMEKATTEMYSVQIKKYKRISM